MYSFRLIPREEFSTIIPFWKILNPAITEKTLKVRMEEMQQQSYECVGIYMGEKLIGISGLWTMTKYYIGKIIEPDNVLILPEYQGKGIGEKMMQWIYAYGKSKGCVASELNCYVTNTAAQKFWVNQGYQIVAFHYQKKF